jgi:hypothetical protein
MYTQFISHLYVKIQFPPIFKAVLAAPCDEETGHSKDLSVALANRSAVLFSLKAYNLALDDIRQLLVDFNPNNIFIYDFIFLGSRWNLATRRS